VEEDWSAVAKAINERVNELGLRQRELAERSHVSQAIVRELQHQTVERKRSARTLEALSLALDWHPGHLAALLRGKVPLQPGETGNPAVDDVVTRLGAIEDRLQEMTDRLDKMNANLAAMVNQAGRPDQR
jgi:transcriptional regulator with XRE-family HTH domain